jgi:hypothetical protein
LFAQTGFGQEDPLSWLSLRVGNHWTYQHEWKTGDRNRPAITRWTTGHTITSQLEIPDGIIVFQRVEQQGQSTGGYLTARESWPYFVHGNCVYILDDAAWDSARKTLREAYRRDLASGKASPEACFPIRIGARWGTADLPWEVATGDPAGLYLPSGQEDAFRIFSNHFGSGGRMDVWLKQGIGILAEHYLHEGTWEEYTKKITSFVAARQP